MPYLHQNIRQLREALGMSQEELAQKLGYKSRSSVNKIELGENDVPQAKIAAFAAALDTTPAALMGWETNERTTPLTTANTELQGYLEELRTRPEMRMLLSVAKDAKKAELEAAVKIIEALRESSKFTEGTNGE